MLRKQQNITVSKKYAMENTVKRLLLQVVSGLLFVCSAVSINHALANTDELKVLSQQFAGASLKAVPAIVEQLEKKGGEQLLPLFSALLDGNLYYRKSDKLVVIANRQNSGEYLLIDAISGIEQGLEAKNRIRKVRSNNKLRKALRAVIARLTLYSKDRALREKAVRNMLINPGADNIALIRQAATTETHRDVLLLMDLALALHTLETNTEQAIRLNALEVLDGSVEPVVRNALQTLLETDSQGNPIERDTRVRVKAGKLLAAIEGKIDFYNFLEKVFFGISLGSILLLVATGLAITFGVMGVINMAHGELIMLGAYTTYVVQLLMPNHIEYSIMVAIPAAFVVSGLVGVLIERGVIQFLHGRPLETLLATFGISLILQQTVRSIFSPLNRQVESPLWMSGSLEFNAVFALTYNRLYVFVFALLVFFALQLVLKKTSLGLQVRAVSQNRDMARAMGIRTQWVDAMTFGLGSGIAGLAGVALSQLTNVGPNLGQAYIIDSFMVVVFGGVGNLWGTLVGGFTLGITNKFLEPVTGAVLANIIVLVFIILFIQKRPKGLFPQKGRAAD